MSGLSDNVRPLKIAVVIPCYKVRDHLGRVVGKVGQEVSWIICVDDACPEGSGAVLAELAKKDGRVVVLTHEVNGGVGAAVKTGYREALKAGADVVVKIDGDGQMDPSLIPDIVRPIVAGTADYSKGNRFYNLAGLKKMPAARIFGNAVLTFFSKFSSGYYSLFDPTNGYTAIHANALGSLPLEKIHDRYFFESDMLFRLNTIGAVVREVPMDSSYGDEESSLSKLNAMATFPGLHLRNFCKRIFYNYFLRNFSPASMNLVAGVLLSALGFTIGIWKWIESVRTGITASAGTVMLAALPVIAGTQLILSFLNYDMTNQPSIPLQSNPPHHRSFGRK